MRTYVYELRDPRNGAAFYVGRGTGDRAFQHQREVLNGSTAAMWAARIGEILADGRQVEVAILAEYALEEDALDHEFHAQANVVRTPPLSPVAEAESRVRRARELTRALVSVRSRVPWSEERMRGLDRRINAAEAILASRIAVSAFLRRERQRQRRAAV